MTARGGPETTPRRGDLSRIRDEVATGVVGRARELELILAAVSAGRDLMLEGPPGTSKSTILRAITRVWGIPLLLVEGNADLTPAKLIGHHNPARVLREDYSEENFVPGPLTEAMQRGGFLYIEEFNRAPEDTLNTLLTAMAERELNIPRVGVVKALDSFRLVAAMNPFDNVGTQRISVSVHDRMSRLAMDYQSEEEEVEIVETQTGTGDDPLARDAVALVRASRSHPEVRIGSSVRGAIDLVLVASQLDRLREGSPYEEVVLDAALVALSGRITLYDTAATTPEAVIRQLWEDRLRLRPHRAAPGDRRIEVPDPAVVSDRPAAPEPAGRRPLARQPKQLEATPVTYRPGTVPIVARPGAPREAGEADEELPGAVVAMTTDEGAELRSLEEILEAGEPDPELWAMVDDIARRISSRRRRGEAQAVRGRGTLTTVPYREGSDDIDLDRTLEVLAERPVPEDSDILVRERVQTQRALVLIGDVSGSMRGEKARITAATIAALTTDFPDDELAVVAFWQDAAVLQPLGERVSARQVLTNLLRIPTRGLTNVHWGLTLGLAELERSRSPVRIGILLSDAVHNAGPDPRDVASGYDRLHVLLETDGEHDVALAEDLARAGRGRLVKVAGHGDVPEAVNSLLTGE